MIAYLWFIEKDNLNELRVTPTAGGTPRTLWRSPAPGHRMRPFGWTPDGKRLVVVHSLPDKDQFEFLSVDNGAIQVVKTITWRSLAALSPDGKFIAYGRPDGGEKNSRDIYVMASDGTSDTPVVEGPTSDGNPIWTSDGRTLLFLSTRLGAPSLWSVNIQNGVASGAPKLAHPDMYKKNPLGIDRQGVLYSGAAGAGGTNLYSADLDAAGKAVRPPHMLGERFLNSNRGASISPDGTSLAYYSMRPGVGLILVIRDLKTAIERELPLAVQIVSVFSGGPQWFADGGSVLVTATDSQHPGSDVHYRVNVADGKLEELLRTKALQGIALSPDSKSLYYSENEPGAGVITTRLVKFDLDTKREEVLKSGSWVIEIAVSPDSRQLAYLVSDRGTQERGGPSRASRLEVMPTVGGEPRVAYRDSVWLDGSRYNGLSWSPDGNSLVFVRGSVGSNGTSALWRVPAGGGQAEQIGISRKGQIKAPQMSPDGKQLYFTGIEPEPLELWTLEGFLPKARR